MLQIPTLEPQSWGMDSTRSDVCKMDLVHSFVTTTCITLWSRTEGQLVWRDHVFREALQQPSLMDGILALTAMHRLALSPSTAALREMTLVKQGALLRGLVALLASGDTENCQAAFPLSLIVTFWAFASKNLPPEFNILSEVSTSPSESGVLQGGSFPRTHLYQFFELINLIRPVNAVVQTRRSWLFNSMFCELMRVPNMEQLPGLSIDTAQALERLKSHLQQHHEDDLVDMVESPSLTSLRNTYRLAYCPKWAELIVGWAIQLPASFVTRLRNLNHAALVLLSYWAVCFTALDGRWWAAGWSKALVSEIDSVVQGEWSYLLEWPNRALDIQSFSNPAMTQSKELRIG